MRVDFSILSQTSLGRAHGVGSYSCVLYLYGCCMSFFFLALFVKLLNRGELQMVGNISVSLLVHDKRGGEGGRRARNNGRIEVLSPDGKNVVSSWLYFVFNPYRTNVENRVSS
jgi:hypothetical protein